MADVYDQQIEAPDFGNDDYINDDGYSKRRTKALESFNAGANVEQDATILAAIHNDNNNNNNGYADEWMGAQHSIRNAKYIPASSVQMQIQNSASPHSEAPPPPPLPSSDIIKSVESDITIDESPKIINIKEEAFKPSICIHFIVLIFVTLIFGAIFYYFYLFEWSITKKFYNMSYAAILWTLCILFLFLNFFDIFHKFHESFSNICRHRASTIFVAFSIFFGLIEYILWSLVEERLFLNEDLRHFDIWLIAIDIIWYIFFFCLFCSAMSNWPTLSYYLSESAWIHGLLYMSLIGYVFIWICRKLRPPNSRYLEWYKERDSLCIIFEIMKVISWLFLIFVFLSGLVVPLFGEGVAFVSEFGPFYAIFGYVILSFAVMLTPLMPGSIIDVAGGFLIVYVLVDNIGISFSFAWIIAVFTIICLHYAGACAQWCIGSMRFVQFWLNRSLPPELLAASDSVLEEAGCATVGLIGYIFLDTANGLNQGRINMRFWTQLCSEWSCIPNAFAVVSLGATISLPSLYDEGDDENVLFGLERILIPLLALIAALVQFSGLTFAARTLGKSVDSDNYMMAREKWTAVQFFYKVTGYVPSRQGWSNDVLQLAKANAKYPSAYRKCLFEDVMPLQRWYVNATKTEKIKSFMQEQKISSSTKVKLLILEKYRLELDKIRNLHYTTIEAQYESLINEKRWLINPKEMDKKKSSRKVIDYLIESDDDGDANQYFSEQNVLKYTKRRVFLIILLIIFLLTFWFCFVRIYWRADFFERVALGIKVFDEKGVTWYDWTTFVIFVIAWTIYNHYFILKSLKNSGKQFCFMITCCRINKNIESRFKTPSFDTRQFDESGNLKDAYARSPNSTSSLPTDISKKLYVQGHINLNDDDEEHASNDQEDNVKDVGF